MTNERRDSRMEYQRLLVQAGRAEAPPQGARGRTLSAIGISTGAGLAGAKAAAASASVGAASGSVVLAKALIWGTIAGAVGMGVVQSFRQHPAEGTRSLQPSARMIVSAPTEESTPARIAAASAEPSAEPAQRRASAKSQLPSAAPEAESNQMLLERQVLEGARKALAAGRASSAVKALNEYGTRFGFGILGHEATVLRIEALLALGRSQDARDLGERYLIEHPRGAQVPAVRRLLGSAEK